MIAFDHLGPVAWVGTAVDTVAARAHISLTDTFTQVIRYEVIVAEAAAFIVFFVFIYYDTIVLYAIIRGKGIWTSSIAAAREASGFLQPQPYQWLSMLQFPAVKLHTLCIYNGYPAQPPNPQYYNYPPGFKNTQPPPGGYAPALSGNAPLTPAQLRPIPRRQSGPDPSCRRISYQEQPHRDKSSYPSLKEVEALICA
ncbi:hypothetical protein DFJ58DRAFT_735287 [Suillus subalutaceus]|uniref:uncharacterized protein n=1 Tax=Suillus subalutaceus TaxID=48586 RepID=UPI001B874A3B|nr:uncharacterized protein DFJ58DRAFT_735287 [Suillus subalutaceus]KAG1836009.1 hypothetical protein DFJ58DRAFT_735287 [Suillus subalutaceus]